MVEPFYGSDYRTSNASVKIFFSAIDKMARRRRNRGKTTKVAKLRPATRKAIKAMIRRPAEIKYQFQNFPDFVLGSQRWYAADLTQYIVQGTAANNRIGNVINNVYVKSSFALCWQGATIGGTRLWAGGNVRVLLVKTDQNLSTTQNVIADVTTAVNTYLFTSNTVQTVNGMLSPNNVLTVLLDKTFKCSHPTITGSSGVGGFQGPQTIGHISHKLCARQKYNGGSGVQPTLVYNYYLLMTSSIQNSSVGDYMASCQIATRTSWRDGSS